MFRDFLHRVRRRLASGQHLRKLRVDDRVDLRPHRNLRTHVDVLFLPSFLRGDQRGGERPFLRFLRIRIVHRLLDVRKLIDGIARGREADIEDHVLRLRRRRPDQEQPGGLDLVFLRVFVDADARAAVHVAATLGPLRQNRPADLARDPGQLRILEHAREFMPFRNHRDLAGGERFGESVPVPGRAARRRDLQQLAVEFGRRDRFGRREQRLARVFRADVAEIFRFKIVPAVRGQHVAEVVHEGVVLFRLVAGAVFDLRDDARLRLLVDPERDLVVLVPGHVGPRRPVVALLLHEQILVLLEDILAVREHHRRVVVRQRVQVLPVPHVAADQELRLDEVLQSARNGRQRRIVVERVQVDEMSGLLRENLVRVGVDDMVVVVARVEVQTGFFDHDIQIDLLDVDLDAGRLLEHVNMGGESGGWRRVLGDDVERDAFELPPVESFRRFDLRQALDPAAERIGTVGRAGRCAARVARLASAAGIVTACI